MNTTTLPASNEASLDLHTGLVRWFDSRPDKLFGFITLNWMSKDRDTFFHLNDCMSLVKGKQFPILTKTHVGRVRHPEKGDLVIFKISSGTKGPKACPWSYLSDYEEVTRVLFRKPIYRLVGEYPVGAGVTFWSGLSLDTLYIAYPDCRENLGNVTRYVRNTSTVENIRLEILEAGEDPMTSKEWKKV